MFHKATNFLRSQSFYRKYGPNLPISLTHRVSIRPKATNLGDLMRLSVRCGPESRMRASIVFSRIVQYAPDHSLW